MIALSARILLESARKRTAALVGAILFTVLSAVTGAKVQSSGSTLIAALLSVQAVYGTLEIDEAEFPFRTLGFRKAQARGAFLAAAMVFALALFALGKFISFELVHAPVGRMPFEVLALLTYVAYFVLASTFGAIRGRTVALVAAFALRAGFLAAAMPRRVLDEDAPTFARLVVAFAWLGLAGLWVARTRTPTRATPAAQGASPAS